MSAMPSESKTTFLLLSSASASGSGAPPVPSRAELRRVDRRDAAAGRRGRRLLDAPRGGVPAGRRRPPGGGVALDADELDVRAAQLARDDADRVGVVALQRGELAVLDVAVQEADVAVGAEVVPAAPVVGDDVAGARVLRR